MDLLRYRDELIITRITGNNANRFRKAVNGDASDGLDWSLDILPIIPKRERRENHLRNFQDLNKRSLQENHITSLEEDYGESFEEDYERSLDEDIRTSIEDESEYTTDMLPAAFCEATVMKGFEERAPDVCSSISSTISLISETISRHLNEQRTTNENEADIRSIQPDTTAEGPLNFRGLQRDKKFRCSDCNYSTDVSSHFRAHKRRHTGERPYACHLCPYRAAESCTLNRHKLTHSGAKKHHCPLCPYRAFLAGDIAKHMRCHTGERPYSCPLCSYRASRRSSVKEHLATHSLHKEYECELCGHKSATRIQLRRHLKNKHFL